jgi:23S rRNA pseudouridine955/2504/2580 synthase
MELRTGEDDKDRRLDRVLRKALPDYPLPLLHRLLRQGKVFVNGKPAQAQYRINCGEVISIPSMEGGARTAARVIPLPHPQIIWQGMGLIAVNKPAGLEVHGPNSLDAMVRSFLAGTLPPSLSFTPGPLHRLDKPSSGIVIFSTNIDGARTFSALMRERKVRKTYLALVEGAVQTEEKWQDELVRDKEQKKTFVAPSRADSKTAVTLIKPLASNSGYSLVTAEIFTGRTHQIRAQAAAHGHPLAGDKKYGGHGQHPFFLHAWKMEFLDFSIKAPLPTAFEEKITALFGLAL